MKDNHKRFRRLKIGFVMDPMEKILLRWDTSMAMMIEAQNRGHRVFYMEPSDLFADKTGVFGTVREVSISRASGFRVISRNLVNLNTFDVICNRKDPPFDISYLYLTHLLELLEPDVFILNSPSGVRKANEKLYILEFPAFVPPSLVSNSPKQIDSFRRQLKSDIVLKPLDQKGGTGIKLLPYKTKNASRLLNQMTKSGGAWIMAQKFMKKIVTSGDKRILLLNGRIIGQFARLPKPGEFRTNLSLGGKHVRTTLDNQERKIVQALRPKLIRDGLYFVGIDVVDGKLIEINVTSPAGITEVGELEGTRPEVRIVDFLEAKALKRSL